MKDKAMPQHRYPDQVDCFGGRMWPTYWAKFDPNDPKEKQEIHTWNVDHPRIGFIDNVRSREEAELILRAVNAHDALVAAAIKAETELKFMLNAHPERDGGLYRKALDALTAALLLVEGEGK